VEAGIARAKHGRKVFGVKNKPTVPSGVKATPSSGISSDNIRVRGKTALGNRRKREKSQPHPENSLDISLHSVLTVINQITSWKGEKRSTGKRHAKGVSDRKVGLRKKKRKKGLRVRGKESPASSGLPERLLA